MMGLVPSLEETPELQSFLSLPREATARRHLIGPSLGVKGRAQSQGEETGQNNRRSHDLRYAVLEQKQRRYQEPPKWSIPGSRGHVTLVGSGVVVLAGP